MDNIPDISSFQYDKIVSGHIESNVNMYRGAVCFDYSLIELQRQENVGISIGASYNSDIDKTLTLRSLDAPTGIMGLGWRLTYEKIECSPYDAVKKPQCRSYRLTTGDNSGGGMPLHLKEIKDGILYFENEVYDYSLIEYDSINEIWKITDRDGIIRTYGGSGRLAYAVACDGRYTENIRSDKTHQSRAVKGWNLSEIIAPGGFKVTYDYTFVEQEVTDGGLKYTKAAYISSVSDSYGNKAEFKYKDKEWSLSDYRPREYSDPHRDIPSDTYDYYQSEYETKYLSCIALSNAYNKLYSIEFGYELRNYAVTLPVMGDTYKRFLKSICMKTENGSLPSMEFTYNGENKTNPGALKSILYPEGGTVEYIYGQIQALAMSDRTKTIPDSGEDEGTRTYFGSDYAVIIRGNGVYTNTAVYEWIGRWQKYTPENTLKNADPNKITVFTEDNYSVVKGAATDGKSTEYIILTKRRKINGGWKASELIEINSDSVDIITGSDWFFTNDTNEGKLSCYSYDALSEEWQSQGFPDSECDDGYVRYVSVYQNRVFIFDYDEQSVCRHKISIYERNMLGEWTKLASAEDESVFIQGGADGCCNIVFDGYIAAGTFVSSKADKNISYTLKIWQLDGNGSIKCEVEDKISIFSDNTDYTIPIINENTIMASGYLYRLENGSWERNDSLAMKLSGTYQFAAASDAALCSVVRDGSYEIKSAVFDSLNGIWESKTLEKGEAGDIPCFGVSICGNIAVGAAKIYNINSDGFNAIDALDKNEGSVNVFNNGICLAGAVYEKTDDGATACRSYIRTFRNGVLCDKTYDDCVFSDRCGGRNDIFTLEDKNGNVKLLFAGGGEPNKPVEFYQAAYAVINDGIDSLKRFYTYNPAYASCDKTGQYARYARVSVRAEKNKDNRTEYRYKDSVSEAQETDNITESSEEDGTLLEVNSYLDGCKDNSLTAEYEFTDIVGGKTIYGSALKYGKLTRTSEIGKDGIGICNVTEFHINTVSGAPREIITYNYNINGELETCRQTYKFAYEEYEEMKQQHRLSDLCSSVITIDGNTVSSKKKTYACIDGHFAEQSAVIYSGENSKTLYNITSRGTLGEVTSKEGTFPEYFMFDKNRCCRVGEFTNMYNGEGFAYCFEEYETELYKDIDSASVTDEICYAGTRCLKINAGRCSSAVKHSFTASGIDYGFAFFARCKAGCSLKIKSGNQEKTVSVEEGDFGYNLVDLRELKFTRGEDAELEFMFVNGSDEAMYVDILSFFALLNPPRINVYYNGGALLAAVVSGYGDISETVYDKCGRAVCVVNSKRAAEVMIPSFMRETNSKVNSTLAVKNAGEGVYVKRSDNIEAALKNLQLGERFFISFFAKGNMNIKLREALYLIRKEGSWQLTNGGSKIYTTAIGDGEYITIVFGENIILAVDGKVIMYFDTSKCDTADCGNTALEIKADNEIHDFIAGIEPVCSISFTDGTGKLRQSQYLNDGQTSVAGRCYDKFGRECAVTIPKYVESEFRYLAEFIKGIDETTGEMKGTIVSEDNKYPYYSTVYENRSGGRIIENGAPCADFAVNHNVDVDKRHTLRRTYSENISVIKGMETFPKKYTVVTVRDPDNNEMITVYDLKKNKIAEAVNIGKEQQLLTTYSIQYRDGVREVKVTLPEKNNRIFRYDFLGRLIYSKDVNAGEVKYFYNANGDIRFIKDSVVTGSGYCRYCIYDSLYRLTEEGLCPTVCDNELYSRVDDSQYPSDGKIISKKYYYDGDYSINSIGAMTKVEIFDESGENALVSTIAFSEDREKRSFTRTVSIGNSSYSTVTFYDNFGNVIKQIGTDRIATEYSYNSMLQCTAVSRNGENIVKTVYRADGMPASVTSCGSEISYEYNAQGKITCINSPFYKEDIVYLKDGKYYNGKIKSITSEIKNISKSGCKITYNMLYNENGQLLSAECEDLKELSITNIMYDKNGNMISCTAGGEEKEFKFKKENDEMISSGAAEYEYNEAGAVKRIIRPDNAIDVEYYKYSGLPKSFKSGGMTMNLKYDENNMRLSKEVLKNDGSSYSSLYFYDDSRLAEEIRCEDKFKYIYGKTGLNALCSGNKNYSVITDHLGSGRVIAECNKILQAFQYKPFGEAIEVVKNSELIKLLFDGYELDKETGLYYVKERMYDPNSYRFLSPDINGEFASPYLFCGGDPFAMIDSNGESSWIASLIGLLVSVVLTIAITTLTIGSAAPVAVAAFGAGGTSFTLSSGAAAAAGTEIAAKVGYTIAMSFATAAISGIAGEGVKSAIDGEPFTAAAVYDTLIGAASTGLVFGGVGTVAGVISKGLASGSAELIKKVGVYAAEGAVMSLVNSGVSAAVSPLKDIIGGTEVSGWNALTESGFGALSSALSVAASRISGKFTYLKKTFNEVGRETLNDTIGTFFDPKTQYDIISEAVSSNESQNIYDDYNVGTRSYIKTVSKAENEYTNNQIMRAYACFGASNSDGNGGQRNGCINIISPRFFVTRGFGGRIW